MISYNLPIKNFPIVLYESIYSSLTDNSSNIFSLMTMLN